MNIIGLLRILFTPACWIRNYPTSKKLTKFINDSLDAGHIPVVESRYTHKLNGKIIWTGNYPYAYGLSEKRNCAPDRITVFRLFDVINDKDQPF